MGDENYSSLFLSIPSGECQYMLFKKEKLLLDTTLFRTSQAIYYDTILSISLLFFGTHPDRLYDRKIIRIRTSHMYMLHVLSSLMKGDSKHSN